MIQPKHLAASAAAAYLAIWATASAQDYNLEPYLPAPKNRVVLDYASIWRDFVVEEDLDKKGSKERNSSKPRSEQAPAETLILAQSSMPLNADKGESEVQMQETQGIAAAPEPAPQDAPQPTPAPESTPPPERPPMPLNADKGESEVSMQETQGIAPLPSESAAPQPEPATPPLGAGPLEIPGAASTPTGNVTINLINKLVERGILTRAEADEMIRQAEAEAMAVRAQSQSEMVAIAEAAAIQATASAAPAGESIPASPEDIRVTHIPAPVKDQIKEEIKLELATDRATGQIAEALKLPEWFTKAKPVFDLRFRYAGSFFPAGNDSSGAFPNFNAINTGLPFDTTGTQFAPQLNTDQNRNLYLLRARLALDFDMGENFTSGLRISTGNNNNPVSTNQGMGYPGGQTGQGGQFSKYAIWLDRAFIRYDQDIGESFGITGWVGRFDNPFFSTRLVWDDDIGFDGAALTLKGDVTETFQPYLTGGAFVVYNTDFNFSTNRPEKFPSYDKYLFAAQTGFEWEIADDWTWKTGAAMYWFHNIEGQLSTPFTPTNINDAGNTDGSRPSFAQKGNTYMALRDIIPDFSNDYGAINQWQYYGLATKFNELALTTELSYDGFEPLRVSLVGEFVQNLAFDQSAIDAIAVNNRGPVDTNELTDIGSFEGSPYGWYTDLRVGTPALKKRGDWLLYTGYRWIGSDAVVDGFNDSDFGWGGTNMQGFTAGGFLSLSENVYVGLRWMGSDSIAGPEAGVNIFYVEIDSKF